MGHEKVANFAKVTRIFIAKRKYFNKLIESLPRITKFLARKIVHVLQPAFARRKMMGDLKITERKLALFSKPTMRCLRI